MVRVYTRKTDRGNYGQTNLADALEAIKNGFSINRASKEYSVAQRTLRRHREGKVSQPGVQRFGRCKSYLPSDIEFYLKEHVINMQRRFYGLRMQDLQHLAFDLCEKAKISHPFNKENKAVTPQKSHSIYCFTPPLSSCVPSDSVTFADQSLFSVRNL